MTTAAESWPLPRGASIPRIEDSRNDPFARLVAAFRSDYAALCRLSYLIVGDSVIAEDIVQEAFLRTFAGWRRVREPERVAIYLRRAVINLSRSRLRSRGSELRANALYSSGNHPGVDTEDYASTSVVVEAVRNLPDRQRSAILLRYFLDLPENEIAETLGTSVGTVKSQLHKARRSLSRVLEVPGHE